MFVSHERFPLSRWTSPGIERNKSIAALRGENNNPKIRAFSYELLSAGGSIIIDRSVPIQTSVVPWLSPQLFPRGVQLHLLKKEEFGLGLVETVHGEINPLVLGGRAKDRSAEGPVFTRPEVFEDLKVPEVLLSGHHQKVALWRRKMSIEKTLKIRPDLLKYEGLSDEDKRLLATEFE